MKHKTKSNVKKRFRYKSINYIKGYPVACRHRLFKKSKSCNRKLKSNFVSKCDMSRLKQVF